MLWYLNLDKAKYYNEASENSKLFSCYLFEDREGSGLGLCVSVNGDQVLMNPFEIIERDQLTCDIKLRRLSSLCLDLDRVIEIPITSLVREILVMEDIKFIDQSIFYLNGISDCFSISYYKLDGERKGIYYSYRIS
jgi:hypothetical protein